MLNKMLILIFLIWRQNKNGENKKHLKIITTKLQNEQKFQINLSRCSLKCFNFESNQKPNQFFERKKICCCWCRIENHEWAINQINQLITINYNGKHKSSQFLKKITNALFNENHNKNLQKKHQRGF